MGIMAFKKWENDGKIMGEIAKRLGYLWVHSPIIGSLLKRAKRTGWSLVKQPKLNNYPAANQKEPGDDTWAFARC